MIDELRGFKRPVADISFKQSKAQTSSFGALHVGALLLTETCTDPVVWKARSEPQLSFVIPLSGSGSVVGKRHQLKWSSTNQILQLPYAHPVEVYSDKAHVLAIVPAVEELKRAIIARPSAPKELVEKITSGYAETHSGKFNGVDYLSQINELLTIVEQAHGNEAFLARIGIDDIFIRLLAEMLVEKATDAVPSMPSTKRTRSEKAVDLICEHIRSNIGYPLTIPRMEKLTGVSGRALNYAFQARFNCSPQVWQRNYLLDEARARLTTTATTQSVKAVAYELGFSSSSSFSAYYKRRFGTYPSRALTTVDIPVSTNLRKNTT